MGLARTRSVGFPLLLSLSCIAAGNRGDAMLHIDGPEQSRLDLSKPGGGLPPALGVQNIEVFRATRDRADLSDGKGYTYHHHVDLAVWKGKLWLAWDSCERDEDTWPSHELYSTSSDGVHWPAPIELFPQGVSTPLRLYFFHAPNGRMLTFAGLRTGHGLTTEDTKGALVVREIHDDDSLGPVCTLRPPANPQTDLPAAYDRSTDAGFVEACHQLLANHPLLQTQDFGALLDPVNRMKWNDDTAWPGGNGPEGGVDFGKAMSFFHRKDGALVGVSKKGWVTLSTDEGASWAQPAIPSTLITGNGKVWGQRTTDGRFALVYNPDKRKRFPMVVVTSEDGVAFSNMRDVHSELPPMRYPGVNKNAGPSYVRGVSEWSCDGSRHDDAMWLAYSMNKEDIWVTRVPVPILPGETKSVSDDFAAVPAGDDVPGWNIYRPKWSTLMLAADGAVGAGTRSLLLEDRDPVDHAAAVRLFPESAHVRAVFEVSSEQTDRGTLEIGLWSAFGGVEPVQLTFERDGNVHCGKAIVAAYEKRKRMRIAVEVDCGRRSLSVSVDGKPSARDGTLAAPVDGLDRISFRAISDPSGAADVPGDAVAYRLYNLHVETAEPPALK